MNFQEAIEQVKQGKTAYRLLKSNWSVIMTGTDIYFKFGEEHTTAMLCISIETLISDDWQLSKDLAVFNENYSNIRIIEEDPNSWANKGRYE